MVHKTCRIYRFCNVFQVNSISALRLAAGKDASASPLAMPHKASLPFATGHGDVSFMTGTGNDPSPLAGPNRE